MQKITPFLWFKANAEEAVNFYEMWEKLSEGGEKGDCGWLKDRFGLSWQVNPPILAEMLQDKDAEKARRVMEAMMQMGKIDIQTLKHAYEGNSHD